MSVIFFRLSSSSICNEVQREYLSYVSGYFLSETDFDEKFDHDCSGCAKYLAQIHRCEHRESSNIIQHMTTAVVVIDVGSASVKVGWAGDDSPIVLPSVVDDTLARPQEGGRANVSSV